MDELVTVEEFIRQVFEIEGVEIRVSIEPYPNRLVRPYKYKKLPDTATVYDLNERIQECLRPFVYIIKI